MEPCLYLQGSLQFLQFTDYGLEVGAYAKGDTEVSFLFQCILLIWFVGFGQQHILLIFKSFVSPLNTQIGSLRAIKGQRHKYKKRSCTQSQHQIQKHAYFQ